jgi:hypothetical protein
MLHESMACCASIIQQCMDAMNREHVLNYTIVWRAMNSLYHKVWYIMIEERDKILNTMIDSQKIKQIPHKIEVHASF